MQPKDLYQYSRALDNEPAFRNISYRPGPDAFNDLLDPGETSSDATTLAFHKVSRMRATVNEATAFDQTSLYHIFIERVFQRAIFYPSRYGDGSFPVWYGCLDPQTAVYETAYHMIEEEKDLAGRQSEIIRRRLVCRVTCTAILIDLTRDRKFFPQLIDSSSYHFTQQIGKRIREEQHPGLLCPSARHPEGKNLAIFNGACLSNPELIDQLVYCLNLESMTINVYREDQITTTIDGNQFDDHRL
jgi:RES domain-containing protein